MVALFALVAFGDDYPWPVLMATAGLAGLWLLINRAKKAWKRGTDDFAGIMDEELGR